MWEADSLTLWISLSFFLSFFLFLFPQSVGQRPFFAKLSDQPDMADRT